MDLKGIYTADAHRYDDAEALYRRCGKRLKRMNLDYVDLFYSHRYDPNTPLEENMKCVHAKAF